MPTTTTPDDLDWLAFRYVQGELEAADLDAFEARLDRDQSAREAVAAAVGLLDTLAAAAPVHPPVPARRRLRRPFLLGAGLAAAASVALALFAPRHQPLPVEETKPTGPEVAAAALAWSDLQARAETNPTGDEPWDAADPVGPVAGPPSWLVLAATGEPDPDALDGDARRED